MKTKQIFELAIRIAGLFGTIKIAYHWLRFWHKHHWLFGTNHSWAFILEILLFLIGIYMVVAAPKILSWLRLDDNDAK